MSSDYAHFADLAREIEVPADGTLTRTLHNDDHIKVVLFGFSAGQELSEHTASMPAVLHFLEGQAALTLGSDVIGAQPGTWVHLPANLPHSIQSKTAVIMLLLLLKPTTAGQS